MKFTDILTNSAHAFIVEAATEEARASFVKKMVQGFNCLNENIEARPCGNCPSCRQIEAGTSMDVFHMEKSGKSAYKVDDAAAFIARLGMGSYGRHIIGIIDEADLLSEKIQNKLLKTLEEPEEGAVIIMATSNQDNLIRTVRSRCNSIRVSDYTGVVEKEIETDDVIRTVADLFIQQATEVGSRKGNFCDCRTAIDKKIKNQADAIVLLGLLEDEYRNNMLSGHSAEMAGRMVAAIDLVELARKDIYCGMSYGKALRRLFLELA